MGVTVDVAYVNGRMCTKMSGNPAAVVAAGPGRLVSLPSDRRLPAHASWPSHAWERRRLRYSIVLGHGPEDLYMAVVAVRDRDIVSLVQLLEHLIPILVQVAWQALQECRLLRCASGLLIARCRGMPNRA